MRDLIPLAVTERYSIAVVDDEAPTPVPGPNPVS